jgi:hypothetical protein
MAEDNMKNVTDNISETNSAAPKKSRSPYAVFLWGGLIMAALCFYLGTTRLAIKRPARADAYFITGILGILSAAMAWSLGKAHERSLRSQQTLKDSVDRLQDSMVDMPRSLMEESVRVAEREAAGRRADQERQARELREALEGGIRTGFAPLAPALSERIEASLSGLSGALRDDREERAKGLRDMAETIGSLQVAQKEWAVSSSGLLEKLREQGAVLHKEIGERDASGRAALSEVSTAAAQRFQAAADAQLEKIRALTEGLAKNWDAAAQRLVEQTEKAASAVTESSRAALDTALGEAREQWTSLRSVSAAQQDAFAAERKESLAFAQEYFEKSSDALLKGLSSTAEAVKSVSAEAESSLRANADQAATWLESLSGAAGKIEAALQGMRQGGEESAAQQAEWRATVDMFHQGLGGVLDRLQSLASFTQGQEALLHKMEAAIRAFEDRSAELLEETALKAQESLLEALDQAGARAANPPA